MKLLIFGELSMVMRKGILGNKTILPCIVHLIIGLSQPLWMLLLTKSVEILTSPKSDHLADL